MEVCVEFAKVRTVDYSERVSVGGNNVPSGIRNKWFKGFERDEVMSGIAGE